MTVITVLLSMKTCKFKCIIKLEIFTRGKLFSCVNDCIENIMVIFTVFAKIKLIPPAVQGYSWVWQNISPVKIFDSTILSLVTIYYNLNGPQVCEGNISTIA